jgi:hypothetical protein
LERDAEERSDVRGHKSKVRGSEADQFGEGLGAVSGGIWLAMEIFEVSKHFPPEERYALYDSNQEFVTIGLPQRAGSVGEAAI